MSNSERLLEAVGLGSSTADEGDEGVLDPEVVFETLSNRRRRYALHALLQSEEEVRLRDLSRQVAAWENEKPVETVTSRERRRTYNALQQSHLPKMDDVGVVVYNRARGIVEKTERMDRLRIYLEFVPENDIPWSTYYLLLGAFSIAFGVVTVGNVQPFAAVPPLLGVVLPGVLLVASGVVHTFLARRHRLGRAGSPPERDIGQNSRD